LFEEFGEHTLYDPEYQADAYLVFGCESKGLPDEILDGMKDRTHRLPMRSNLVRSLNLANTATAVIYQAMRGKLGG
jgi:tRNA (cytidine/uridine-2'-O-)-methyltransferase